MFDVKDFAKVLFSPIKQFLYAPYDSHQSPFDPECFISVQRNHCGMMDRMEDSQSSMNTSFSNDTMLEKTALIINIHYSS